MADHNTHLNLQQVSRNNQLQGFPINLHATLIFTETLVCSVEAGLAVAFYIFMKQLQNRMHSLPL